MEHKAARERFRLDELTLGTFNVLTAVVNGVNYVDHIDTLLRPWAAKGCDVIELQETKRDRTSDVVSSGYRIYFSGDCSGIQDRKVKALITRFKPVITPNYQSLSLSYRWWALPRVCRHRATAVLKVVPVTGAVFSAITMDQLMCLSFSHTHYCYACTYVIQNVSQAGGYICTAAATNKDMYKY